MEPLGPESGVGEQLLPLALILHSFGDHPEIEVVGQGDDRLDNPFLGCRPFQAVDESLVDLQGLEGEPFEVLQRGVAGPEIVDGQSEASSP